MIVNSVQAIQDGGTFLHACNLCESCLCDSLFSVRNNTNTLHDSQSKEKERRRRRRRTQIWRRDIEARMVVGGKGVAWSSFPRVGACVQIHFSLIFPLSRKPPCFIVFQVNDDIINHQKSQYSTRKTTQISACCPFEMLP